MRNDSSRIHAALTTRFWGKLLAGVLAMSAIPHAAAAALNLSDNFEGGSLSPTMWSVLGSAQIVADPLNASNHVLSFRSLAAGGDLFSVPLDLSGPSITLSFDYLGIDSNPGVGFDTGGFIIVDLPNSFSGYVLAGTSSAGGPKLPDMLTLAPGVWHHVSMTFAPSLVQAGDGSKIAFEQWVTSVNGAQNAYFDNINFNAVPEPGAGWLLGVGLVAGGLFRYRCRK